MPAHGSITILSLDSTVVHRDMLLDGRNRTAQNDLQVGDVQGQGELGCCSTQELLSQVLAYSLFMLQEPTALHLAVVARVLQAVT